MVPVKPHRLKRKLRRAKTQARSELGILFILIPIIDIDSGGWTRLNLYKDESLLVITPVSQDQIVRCDRQTTSKGEFIERFERPEIPCIIINAMNEWPAMKSWNPVSLCQKYHNEKFKVGEDDNGDNVYMGLKYFLAYATQYASKDDSPLYIFDSNFGERRRNNTAFNIKKKPPRKLLKLDNGGQKSDETLKSSPSPPHSASEDGVVPVVSHPTCNLLDDYAIPDYFTDDLFSLVGERRRPPYRWIVAGPARSGSGIHIDPLGTSAWNALISGYKRWVLFPPATAKEQVNPPRLAKDHEASTWFAKVYPLFQTPLEHDPSTTLGQSLGMREFIQRPGEIVFIPSGWWHIVLNLTLTTAVTQNFCSQTNFEAVWLKTRFARPKLAEKMFKRFKQFARDERDGFKGLKRCDWEQLVRIVEQLVTVPEVYTSSSGSSSSSSSSSSDDDGTDSESSVDGVCMKKRQ
ncbi:MAG: hypothetical protein SGCHY_004829 [Lobulomycetales sp.]